jgi:hypothetical protein
MREIHAEIDAATIDTFGWGDVNPDHGFHEYRQMVRWTISPAARVEILDRLLLENHLRADERDRASQSVAPRAAPPARGTLFD